MEEFIPYKLPNGWIWTTIGDLCIISSGGTPDRTNSTFYKGEIPWVKSGELNFNIINATEEHINQLALDNSSAKIMPKNTLLVALYGATVGKLAILGIDAATNQAVASLITTNSVSNKYVYYYLLLNKERLLQQRQGGAQPNISQKILNNFKIPLPPLNTQLEIVSKIDDLFDTLEEGQKSLQKASKLIDVFEHSILKSAFEGNLTKIWRTNNSTIPATQFLKKVTKQRKKEYLNSKTPNKLFKNSFEFSKSEEIDGWAVAKLENLITIAARVGWKGLKKDEYTQQGPLLLSVHSLNYGKNVVFKDALHISEARYIESPEIMLEVNDILLCKDGAGIGKIGILKNLPEKATINSSLLLIRGYEIFLPDFLYYLLKGPQMQSLVNDRISGSAIPHLFQKDIKEFILKIPPIEEQLQIINEIEHRLTISENLKVTIKDAIKKLEAFKHKILTESLAGRMLDTHIFEDTNLLLNTIKKEKSLYLETKKIIEKTKPKKTKVMNKNKSIIQVLKESQIPLSAKEVWLQSSHKDDIEAFYSELRDVQDAIIEIKKDTESLLSLRHEN
ncbi:MAG: restriction endonuclease subunit S [Sphingobacteriales bacterium JAD_PAG50586_3]|nr:MAG: restriction endonuclease subunit S [Sphingobacteriales bacterium JAD_PAG50586_3]